ncbi:MULTISPECIES: hypothetical protein [Xanthomonas]|uniref:hypothetical protein n=1 Tax=Xanthomonas TaxID=338 RepID=UPI0011C0684B|nr:hypothetical protein [Xanthomonas campestris]MCC5094776.1 hypothetical protein [Xanthomonas campestris pv. incanae]MEA9613056.1 hypothetical protein [Xanthomonas campestris pv. incanae]WDJ11392.1 hypothetical protein JH299_07835 [Xanthomonas campestris pv. incanae]
MDSMAAFLVSRPANLGNNAPKRNWQVDLTYSIIFEIAMDEIFCLTAVKMSGAINFEYFLITLDISK